MDYSIPQDNFLFLPEDQTLPIPVDIIDDNIAEIEEQFELFLQHQSGPIFLTPSVTARVNIIDNEGELTTGCMIHHFGHAKLMALGIKFW